MLRRNCHTLSFRAIYHQMFARSVDRLNNVIALFWKKKLKLKKKNRAILYFIQYVYRQKEKQEWKTICKFEWIFSGSTKFRHATLVNRD